MTRKTGKFIFVVSTGGAVMNAVLDCPEVRRSVHSVIADRDGEAVEKARRHNVPCKIIKQSNTEEFCQLLLKFVEQEGIDFILSYYTKFYSEELRSKLTDRIINFHPSLLPAFKGMDGFGDTISYGARFAGNTVEFIDQVMDEGKIIMQTSCQVDETRPIDHVRHEIFVQQCKALIQVVHWLNEDRVVVEGRRVSIAKAEYASSTFSPSLDSVEAQEFAPPNPMNVLNNSGVR